MKIVMGITYEEAKQQIYRKELKKEKDALNNVKLFSRDTFKDIFDSLLIISPVIILLFLLAVKIINPDFIKNISTYIIVCASIGLFANLLNLLSYISNKHYYTNLIKKLEEMSLDDYIVYLRKTSIYHSHEHFVLSSTYEDLEKFNSLLSPDVRSIELISQRDGQIYEVTFLATLKNGSKKLIDFECLDILYKDVDEPELIWDLEDNQPVLYIDDITLKFENTGGFRYFNGEEED